MEKYENLKDRELYRTFTKVLKKKSEIFPLTFYSERDFYRELKKFYKLIEEHKKLLLAIGNL